MGRAHGKLFTCWILPMEKAKWYWSKWRKESIEVLKKKWVVRQVCLLKCKVQPWTILMTNSNDYSKNVNEELFQEYNPQSCFLHFDWWIPQIKSLYGKARIRLINLSFTDKGLRGFYAWALTDILWYSLGVTWAYSLNALLKVTLLL